MTFVITKPQQELVPLMTQISNHRCVSQSGGIVSTPNTSTGFYNRYSHSFSFDTPSKRRRRRRKHSIRCLLTLSFGATVILILALPYILSHVRTNYYPPDDQSPTKNEQSDALVLGTISVGEDTISYYHQPPSSPTEENYHLVLLHGSAFTKEDWKTSGILELFGESFPSIAVTALDLPVSADYKQLKQLLGAMRDEDLVEQLPVSGLVTPSASGKSITSWIAAGESSDDMEVYLSLWIPVASNSVGALLPPSLQALQKTESGVDVLAIYGDRDSRGKKTMKKLHDYSGAKLLELPGKHPVYLDSPNAFVDAIGNEILATR